jgi:hypothetical protein
VAGANGRKLAEVIGMPRSLGETQWMGVQFAQTWALRVAAMLSMGKLAVPGKTPIEVKLCALGELGALGYDRRDIHDAFTVSYVDWSPYPAFWNHDANKVLCIRQKPNSHLMPLGAAAKGRKLKDAPSVAEGAGFILLVERIRTTTQRLLALGFEENVLGNTWWSLNTAISEGQRKALLIWLNSTPSLLLILSHRVTTEGPWMQIKKPQWAVMPVLDVSKLEDGIISQLAEAYDRICEKELKALAKLNVDPVRAEIDDALSFALGLPDMKPLRELLAREPGLTGKGLSPKPGQTGLFEDEAPKEKAIQLRLF